MIPTILTTWKCVEIEVDSDTIFTGPLDGFEEIAM